jgi:hypothetical protein
MVLGLIKSISLLCLSAKNALLFICYLRDFLGACGVIYAQNPVLFHFWFAAGKSGVWPFTLNSRKLSNRPQFRIFTCSPVQLSPSQMLYWPEANRSRRDSLARLAFGVSNPHLRRFALEPKLSSRKLSNPDSIIRQLLYNFYELQICFFLGRYDVFWLAHLRAGKSLTNQMEGGYNLCLYKLAACVIESPGCATERLIEEIPIDG